MLSRKEGKDHMLLKVERRREVSSDADQNLAQAVSETLRKALLARVVVKVVDPCTLPRTFSKSKRTVDERYE